MRATLVAAIASFGLVASAAAAPRYVAVPLGTLGGASSDGRAINAAGQITGTAQTSAGRFHAFLYSNGAMADLDPSAGGQSDGNAVNASGQVTGCMEDGDRVRRAFLFDGAEIVLLPESFGSNRLGCGVAIDDSGRVAGQQYWDFQYAAAPSYLYDAGVLQDVRQGVHALNNRGQMAGTAGYHAQPPQAWATVDGFDAAIAALGTRASSGAYAVNAHGWVVGTSDAGGFVYADGAMIYFDRALLPLAINDRGDVVGSSFSRAMLYSEGTLYDLNELVVSGLDGATLTSANGINDNRAIVANSCQPGPPYPEPCKAYRLELAADDGGPAAHVPTLSPAALAALAILVVAAGMALRRR